MGVRIGERHELRKGFGGGVDGRATGSSIGGGDLNLPLPFEILDEALKGFERKPKVGEGGALF